MAVEIMTINLANKQPSEGANDQTTTMARHSAVSSFIFTGLCFDAVTESVAIRTDEVGVGYITTER